MTALNKQCSPLIDAIARHIHCRSTSFHTPGHKGRAPANASPTLEQFPWLADLTELPGLDDLSNPQGVLRDLEARAAKIWGSGESIISVNGASAGIAAAMVAIAGRGTTVLVPRNAHRSLINGLVLSGLFPIWYEPIWDDDWKLWGAVSATSAERLLERHGPNVAGMVVVSPTYAGAVSDIEAITRLCRHKGVPLVVDEAHGTHFVGSAMPKSAIAAGADVVVHSLHKTLSALTQTGMLHVGAHSSISADNLRSALALVQSSSPSYLLMASIEQALSSLEGRKGQSALAKVKELSGKIVQAARSLPEIEVYQPASGVDPAHILIASPGRSPAEIHGFFSQHNIFAEAALGQGLLFMLGLGTTDADVNSLLSILPTLNLRVERELDDTAFSTKPRQCGRPPETLQILSPRQAFLAPSQVVPVWQAIGRISSATIAPCPPGTPVIVAGQRVPPEVLEIGSIKNLRVVVE